MSPSGKRHRRILFRHDSKVNPPRWSIGLMITPPVLDGRIDKAKRAGLSNNLGIDDQGLESRHVSFVYFRAKRRDRSLPIRRQWCKRFAEDDVDPGNYSARMRLDHLGAVTKINLVTVIMRRVMTCGDARRRWPANIAR